MTPLSVATLTGDPELEARLAVSLSQIPDADLVLRCVDRIETLAVIQGGDIDALISVGAPIWLDEQIVRESLARGIRVVSVTDDPMARLHMERLGSFVMPADASPAEILTACRDEKGQNEVADTPRHALSFDGRLVAVWGPKGSPGRTSIAIELAAEIAKSEPATLLIDGDFYGGDIAQLLGLAEEVPTVVWASRMASKNELDHDSLSETLRRPYRQGPAVLSGVKRPDLWAEVSDHGWRELLSVAKSTFRFVVCDVGFCLEPPAGAYMDASLGRNRVARETVRLADHAIGVCRGDAVGLTNFLWSFSELQNLSPNDPLLVVNRARPKTAREIKDLLNIRTGLNTVAFVPDRVRDFERAVATAIPVVHSRRQEDVRDPIARIASCVGQPAPPKGFLTKLAGRA